MSPKSAILVCQDHFLAEVTHVEVEAHCFFCSVLIGDAEQLVCPVP